MEFINNTSSPALSFEGVDTQQGFHVVVMRQTYTWHETGLLILADEQDPLCMTDELVDPNDVMSGVLQESDLCHYKPKCDVIVIGNAYAPKGQWVKNFVASIHIQTPDKVIFTEPTPAGKYQFQQVAATNKPKAKQLIKGETRIDKPLLIVGEQHIERIDESISGRYRLFSSSVTKVNKVSLNPSSSLGGYCILASDHPSLNVINPEKLIPEVDRKLIPIKEQVAPIAYFSQDNYNPYGTGYLTADYIQAQTIPHVVAKNIALPQIQNPKHPISDTTLTQLLTGKLAAVEQQQMVVGFGICAKSHPQRHQYMGKIDEEYLARIQDADKAQDIIPEGFDFAIWNCAYQDQQTEHLKGNEWITLTNLCAADTPAARISKTGDTQLRLYLPETLATLITTSSFDNYPDAEVPMQLDTVIIQPDANKVNLVWRGIIAASYEPEVILVDHISQERQQQLLKEHFTQKGDIVRPYQTDKGAQS